MAKPRLLLFLLLLLGVVGCDHTTKHLAVSQLADSGPVQLVLGMHDARTS